MKSQTLRPKSTPTHLPAQSLLYVKYQLVPRSPSPPYFVVCIRNREMDATIKRKSVNAVLACVLLSFLHKICFAEKICAVPSEPVIIKENNTADTVIVRINTTTKDVTLNITENPGNVFYLKGLDLMVKKGLDFETLLGPEDLTVQVRCNKTGFRSTTLVVLVRIENINDNPPKFDKTEYTLDINELTPINSSIALIEASDEDSMILYYAMEPTVNSYFRLESMYTPNILVNKILDYDVIQQVKLNLYVQNTNEDILKNVGNCHSFTCTDYVSSQQSEMDTPPLGKPSELSFTASTTIIVNIKDIDNRPPWFQPCTRVTLGNAKLCLSLGYKGRVNLTEKQDGALQLLPGPVYARDGDKSRNENISYKIVKGNEDNVFQIDETSGNITMLKPADIAGPISLLVLASQVSNRDQFATTTVTIDVKKKSRNPPRFEKERYEAYVYSTSGPENMVLRDRTSNRPFRVRARDEDFAGGINPDVKYEVQYSSYVNITTDGFLLLKKAVRTDSFALQLRAVDVSTGESGTSTLSVTVLPLVGLQSPEDTYRAGDMALLGFVMAALLVLCLIVIGYLISRVKKANPDAFKLSEVSIFSSKLRPFLKYAQPPNRPRPRDSMQFTNDGFLNEGDTGRSRSRRAELRDRRADPAQTGRVRVIPRERQRHCSSCGVQVQSNHIHLGSPAAQSKGRPSKSKVKSILAKERKRDDRQKTVWFKESEDSSDIEVEIIPDNIGLQPEEDGEKASADIASPPREDGEMELRELTMLNIPDTCSRERPMSDGRDGLNTEKQDQ